MEKVNLKMQYNKNIIKTSIFRKISIFDKKWNIFPKYFIKVEQFPKLLLYLYF